jgi:hypothetical protein
VLVCSERKILLTGCLVVGGWFVLREKYGRLSGKRPRFAPLLRKAPQRKAYLRFPSLGRRHESSS